MYNFLPSFVVCMIQFFGSNIHNFKHWKSHRPSVLEAVFACKSLECRYVLFYCVWSNNMISYTEKDWVHLFCSILSLCINARSPSKFAIIFIFLFPLLILLSIILVLQGRPKGVTPKYSLKPLVPRLSELLGLQVGHLHFIYLFFVICVCIWWQRYRLLKFRLPSHNRW